MGWQPVTAGDECGGQGRRTLWRSRQKLHSGWQSVRAGGSGIRSEARAEAGDAGALRPRHGALLGFRVEKKAQAGPRRLTRVYWLRVSGSGLNEGAGRAIGSSCVRHRSPRHATRAHGTCKVEVRQIAASNRGRPPPVFLFSATSSRFSNFDPAPTARNLKFKLDWGGSLVACARNPYFRIQI